MKKWKVLFSYSDTQDIVEVEANEAIEAKILAQAVRIKEGKSYRVYYVKNDLFTLTGDSVK